MLERLGASEIVQAVDGVAALAWADSDRGPLDLVMCDLRMPELDGIDALDGLAMRTNPGMFVLASAADPRLLRAASSASSAAIPHLRVLSKPITLDKLRVLVDEMQQNRPKLDPVAPPLVFTPPDCSTKMLRSLVNGEFFPFFLPRLRANDQTVCGVEARLRWLSPHGLLGPESFAAVARTTGLLGDIFFAVYPAALLCCAEWRRRGHQFGVTVDLPAPLLAARDLPRRLEQSLAAYGLSAADVTLQVTEDAWLDQQESARGVLTRLRVRGFGLAINEFGAGSSTIRHLLDAPFNEMVIAESFVRAAPTDPEAAIALSSCVALARQLGITAVASGVTTPAQSKAALAVGVDTVQGDLFATPMPADQLHPWLADGRIPSSAM